jgi:Major Facilitator Superfamily
MDLSGYRRFLGTPGVARLFGSMLIGRLPSGMMTLAIVLRITGDGGSYRLAGAVSASFAVGIGLTAPALSRLIDRRGQTVVLVPSALASLATALALAVLPASSPPILLMLAGALLGAALPPLASTSRTMWPAVLGDSAALESAYAADATFQELVFILGPLLVVAVSAVAGTAAAIVCSGALACVGTLVFATSPASRSWRAAGHDGPRNKALRSPGIRVLVVTMFALILGFAAMEVALIAAAREAGATNASGVLLAIWSLGSMAAGFVFGSRSWPGDPSTRVIVLLVATTALVLVLVPQHNLIVIGVVIALSGAGGAPALASIYGTAQLVALPGVVTESYAWLSVGTLFGGAAGAAAAGQVITTHGAGAGFLLGAIGVAVAAAVVGVGRHTLTKPGTGRVRRPAAVSVGG